MPRLLPIVQIDAFTSRPFGGNPAAVVLDAGGLEDPQMEAIAREMNLAETAYLTPPTEAGRARGADYRLRWFTPGTEVTFCGHATVATAHALAEAGRFDKPSLTFETLGGMLKVAREGAGKNAHPTDNIYWLEPEPRVIRPYEEPLEDVLEAMGLSAPDLADWARPALSHESDLILPCRGLDVLRRAKPGPKLGALGAERNLRAFCLTTRETFEPTSSIHSRFFAPQSGITEDPVTGSVHASLAVYLFSLGLVPARFVAEQGDFMGRPGRLEMEATGPRVGGRAVTVLAGQLMLPDQA